MKTKVLVLDSNAAVQAIIASALSPSEIEVHLSSDGSSALEQIRELSPRAVFIANSVENSDALALCRVIKKDSKLDGILVVIMSASSDDAKFDKSALKAGADALLKKPFKSNEVKALVEKITEEQGKKESKASKPTAKAAKPSEVSGPAHVVLHLSDSYLIGLFELFFSKFDISTGSLASLKTKTAPVIGCLVDATLYAEDFNYSQSTMGQLYILNCESTVGNYPPEAILLQRPFSESSLLASFDSILASRETQQAEHDSELSTNEQSLLSARICAQIFERLVTSDSLKQKRWKEVATTVGAETLHTCQEWKSK